VELESGAEWPIEVTRDGSIMGYQENQPMKRHEELQPDRVHKPNQLIKQLEEAVEEIQRLMLRLGEEVINTEKLDRKKPVRVARKMQMQQQEQRGVEGQL